MLLKIILGSIGVFQKSLSLDGYKVINCTATIPFTKMSRPRVFVTRPDVPPIALDKLREQCDVTLWEKPTPIPKAELLSKIKGVDALYCFLTDTIDADVVNAAGSQLKVVSTMSVGVNHLDLMKLKERNVRVGYTPGVLTDATAELIVALLLATSRRLIEANRAIYKNEWRAWAPTWMCGPGLSGSTVGIVGFGRIGCKVAECLRGFNIAKLLYTSRYVKQEALALNAEKVELKKLLQESDFVIVTLALTPDTKQIFNMDAFKQMKKSAIFVNASRGEIVDQSALIKALKTGLIRAAGLDVMVPEPIPLDHELLKLDNCVILPHIGSATIETRTSMAVLTSKNILAALQGAQTAMPTELEF